MTSRETGGRWRSLLLGAAIVASVIALGSCGDDGATTSTTPGTTAATTTVAPSDPNLADAVAAVGGRYGFTASVTVGSVETTHVEGSVYDGTGQYLVTSGDRVVEYIIGPSGQWAREGNELWAVLAGPAPVVDPLTPLAQPSALTVVSSDGDDAVLEATYPPSVLGFSGDEDVVVTLTVVDGALAEIRYTVPAGAGEAVVVTTIDTDSEITPITVPTP